MVAFASMVALPGSEKDFFDHELDKRLVIATICSREQLNDLLLGYLGPLYTAEIPPAMHQCI